MEIEVQQAIMNPFLLAGLVFAGIGLIQEAIFESEKENKGPKKIAGPAGKDGAPGKDGKPGEAGKDGKPASKKPPVQKPSDG